MFKLIVLLKKKPPMSDDEFARHWIDVHAPLARKLPGLRRYVINVVQRPPNREPDYHGAVELWFDDKGSMKKAFSSPEGEATNQDLENFTSGTRTLFVDEHIIVQ